MSRSSAISEETTFLIWILLILLTANIKEFLPIQSKNYKALVTLNYY
jgi:hypothetical protein